MAIQKCERVYAAGIAISILWELVQAVLSRDNWALLLVGLASASIGVYGAWREFRGEQSGLVLKWMAWYLLPAAILLLGHLNVFYDFHDTALQATGSGTMPRPVPKADYSAELVSYWASMAIVPLSLAVSAVARRLGWC